MSAAEDMLNAVRAAVEEHAIGAVMDDVFTEALDAARQTSQEAAKAFSDPEKRLCFELGMDRMAAEIYAEMMRRLSQ